MFWYNQGGSHSVRAIGCFRIPGPESRNLLVGHHGGAGVIPTQLTPELVHGGGTPGEVSGDGTHPTAGIHEATGITILTPNGIVSGRTSILKLEYLCVPPATYVRELRSMRVEYLHSGSPDCPLIRIFGTERAEFDELLAIVRALAEGQCLAVDLLNRPNFVGAEVDSFKLERARTSGGVMREDRREFRWRNTATDWTLVAGFLEPFSHSARTGAFQWLAGPEAREGLEQSSISVLLSNSNVGTW